MRHRVNVLIVDDHPLFREGMKSLLLGLDADANVQQACSVADAQGMVDHPFDLVLVDLQMPGSVGMDALIRVKAIFENSAVVVVSGDESSSAIFSAIQHGAAGYVPKTTDPGVTTDAMRRLLKHGLYLPPTALTPRPDGLGPEQPRAQHPPAPEPSQAALPADPVSKSPPDTRPSDWPGELSTKQKTVLRCLLQGKPNKVIAREIGIAEGTVKAHLWAVYQLLGVNNRAQAMYRAHELKLFDLLDSNAEPGANLHKSR